MKKMLSLAAFCLFMGAFIFTYNKITDGWSLSEIASHAFHIPKSSILNADEKNRLDPLLKQPFHYIGKGAQFYAFESQDGTVVLKFFKQKHLRSLAWMKELPLPSFLRKISDAQIEKREKRVEKLFQSCQIAANDLSLETGILYLHLWDVSGFDYKVTLKDKLGLPHTIDLNDFEFVLQEKGIAIEKVISEGNLRQDKMGSLIDLIVSRCQKGIQDTDKAFVQNVAFSIGQKRAFFVDIGQFVRDDKINSPSQIKQEVLKRLNSFRVWAEDHHLELTQVIDQRIETIE